jgi:hypothetical protein
LRNIVASGLDLLSAVADIQVRTVLGSALLTMAAGPPTGAIGLRQRAENGDIGQTSDLIE